MSAPRLSPLAQCIGKYKYSTKAHAKAGIRDRQTRAGKNGRLGPMQAYRCPHCGFFHYGHAGPWVRALKAGQDDAQSSQ